MYKAISYDDEKEMIVDMMISESTVRWINERIAL